jgi:DNA repair protein RecO (recombination protein O)
MLASSYETSVALDFFAEVSDQMLPPNEVNERQFRLLLAVLEFLRAGGSVWPAVVYFTLWMVRLAGVLPDLSADAESLEIAHEMLVTPISKLTPREWSKETAADLRRFLIRSMEEHVERRFLSAPLLESL